MDLLPVLCRANQDHVNLIIEDDRKTTDKLKELRREDPKTRDAQAELDELQALREAKWAEVRAPGDEALSRKRGSMKRVEGEQKTGAGKEFRALRDKILKERSAQMQAYLESIDYHGRYKGARKVVDTANRNDRKTLSDRAFKGLKKGLDAKFGKYHVDAYYRQDLSRSRKATLDFAAKHPFRALQKNPDQKVQFRSYVRGYGTDLPSEITLETGHSQSEKKGKTGKTGKRFTLAEFRAGKGSNRVVKRLDFPKQSAWDETRPKGERKRDQFGKVEIVVMKHVLRGSCYFHQSVPDTHQVEDVKLKVEVCKGNVQCFLLLVLDDKGSSERKMLLNSYEYNYDRFQEINLEAPQSEETLLEVLDVCKKLKSKASKKKKLDLVMQITTTQETAKRLLSEIRKGNQA